VDSTATSDELRSFRGPLPEEGTARSVALTSEDGTHLHASLFSAPRPAAGLILVHGLQSHAGWFEASGTARDLANAGITCLAYDRRGSGRSGGACGHAESAQDFLLDLDAALVALRRELAAALPVHALANCFGTRALLVYADAHPNAFRSLILTSPATHMRRRASYPWHTRLAIALAPAHTSFPVPLRDEDFVSDGPWLDWIRRDPHALRSVTAGFLRSTVSLERRMSHVLPRLRAPLLLVLSRRDALVDSRAARHTFATRYGGPLRVLEYDTDHYVDFSAARPALVRDIEEWLARVPT
jgi:alpha-beta hydrolase superfamily lysophospholipase